MLTGLNHITLSCSDIETSLRFYVELLGFKGEVKWKKGAYLSLGDLWLCLSLDRVSPADDYTHTAFSVEPKNFQALSDKLKKENVDVWKENKSEGESLYILDPDGHKLEIHVGNLQQRLDSLKSKPYAGLIWM